MNIAEQCRAIYRNLADMQSKMIYVNRLNYSLAGDRSFIEEAEASVEYLSQGGRHLGDSRPYFTILSGLSILSHTLLFF